MTTAAPLSSPGPAAGKTPIGGAPGDAATGSGDLFLALMLGLLDGSAQQPTSGEPAPEGTDSETTEPTDPAADTTTPEVGAVLPGFVALPPVVAAPDVAVDRLAAGPGPAPSVTTPDAPSGDSVIGPAPAVPTGPSPAPAPASMVAPTVASAAPIPATSGTGTVRPDPSAALAADAPVAPTESRESQRPLPVSSTPDTSPPSVVPVAGPPGPTTVPAEVAPTTTQRVSQQVFPEVVRIVTAPQGAQRVTVRLSPESLGDVRVVLTSRPEGLEVTLAGGAEARRALTEGAPELLRLLESVGRADSRIVVRDLAGVVTAQAQPGTAAPPGAQPFAAGADVSTGLGDGAGTGAGRPGGEPAQDQRADQRRADGSSTAGDGGTGGAAPARRIETGTRARTGLDVTM